MKRYLLLINGYPSLFHSGFNTQEECEKEISRLREVQIETNKKYQEHLARPKEQRLRGDCFLHSEDTRIFSVKEVTCE